MGKFAIGVDVGGTKIAYGLFDENHNILSRLEHPTDGSGTPEEICDRMVDGIHQLLTDSNHSIKDITGVGIALPSYINFEKGLIITTSNIVNLKNFEGKKYFEEKLGVRVLLDNDCNVAALAEHRYGAGRGYQHMLYCAISTGIGTGIIINNELFRGSYGAAGETGHMLITPDQGLECGCGNQGCFMSWTSGSMITTHIRRWLDQGQKSKMLELADNDPDKIDARILEDAARSGDELALKALDTMSFYLAIWIFNLYQAFNINAYVFGGGIIKMGDLLFDKIRHYFDKYNVTQPGNEVIFKYAELDKDVGIIGAEQILF